MSELWVDALTEVMKIHGPIECLRVSRCSNAASRFVAHYGIVKYLCTWTKAKPIRPRLVALGHAHKEFSKREEAIEVARKRAKEENLVLILHHRIKITNEVAKVLVEPFLDNPEYENIIGLCELAHSEER